MSSEDLLEPIRLEFEDGKVVDDELLDILRKNSK